jgi:cytochrome c-type biogenesis protein CcmH
MSSFWSVSGFWIVVLLLVGLALAFVLPTLLRRNRGEPPVESASANSAIRRAQLAELDADLRSGTLTADQYGEARRDVEQAMAEETAATTDVVAANGRWAGFALSGLIPVAAVITYFLLGSPDHLVPAQATSARTGGAGQADPAPPGQQHDPAAMVSALEEKLKQNPEDGPGWAMLGRSYVALGRNQEGAQALGKAAQLISGDARLLADYAEAVALTQGRNMAGIPSSLVARALALNAKDQKALMLAGVAASQQQDFAQAADYWRQLLAVIPADSDLARQVAAAIDKAEAAATEGSGGKAAIARQLNQGQAGPGPSIAGTVSISAPLAAKVSPGDTVFIFAQAPQGPPMPLAIRRLTAGELPYRFTLDDSLSMAAGDRLSSHAEVMITARVSKSGQAMRRSGDLEGKAGPVKLGRQDVALAIDQVVP